MNLFELLALILAAAVGIWAVMDRSWQLLLIAIAVVLLALSGEVHTHVIS